jgi:hypothetical protein
MFEELDDDDVLEEKDETSSDDEGGKHGERRVTLSKVSSFFVKVCLWDKSCESICCSAFHGFIHGVISMTLSHQESEYVNPLLKLYLYFYSLIFNISV